MRSVVEAGQLWLIKFHGSGNGDLVCGQVMLAPDPDDFPGPDEHVPFRNLLTGKPARKKVSDLLTRNWLASESEATAVVDVFKREGKAAARACAVALYREHKARASKPAPLDAAAQ